MITSKSENSHTYCHLYPVAIQPHRCVSASSTLSHSLSVDRSPVDDPRLLRLRISPSASSGCSVVPTCTLLRSPTGKRRSSRPSVSVPLSSAVLSLRGRRGSSPSPSPLSSPECSSTFPLSSLASSNRLAVSSSDANQLMDHHSPAQRKDRTMK